MSARVVVGAAALVVLAASCGSTERRLDGDLLIRADRMFDGRTFVAPGAVLVRGGRIVAAGRSLRADALRAVGLTPTTKILRGGDVAGGEGGGRATTSRGRCSWSAAAASSSTESVSRPPASRAT